MNYKVLAIGAVLGFAMALAPSCGPSTKQCDTSNCGGCCTEDGTCIDATATNATQCGASGNACTACGAGQTCTDGACVATTGGSDAGTDGGSPCGNITTGCCLESLAAKFSGTSNSNCGESGNACVACMGEEVCVKTATGGKCQIVDAGNGEGQIGAACTSAADCTNVPVENQANVICKTESTFGNTQYQDGFCTRRCYDDAQCGADAMCIYGIGQYGEGENMCVPICETDDDCREGYGCIGFTGLANRLCLPLTAEGKFPDPVDAGTPAAPGVMGGACTEDGQCQPPESGGCFTETLTDGGLTGYTGGSCTADCTYGNVCGSTGICVGFIFTDPSVPANEESETALIGWLCEQKCSPTQTGQCRPEYACQPFGQNGYCVPRCDQPGNGCPTNSTCDMTTGLCK